MGTRYNTQTAIGYNATPPPDDGSTTENNRTTWAKHKTKLGDPVKVLADKINQAILIAFNINIVAAGSNITVVADHHDRLLNVTGAFTVTLPDASIFGTGFRVHVRNAHTANITVDLALASNTLDGVLDGTISLPPFHEIMIHTDEIATGYVTDGQFRFMRRDADQVMDGILTLANKLVLQQKVSETANATSSGGNIDLDLDTGTYFYTPVLTSIPTFTFSNPDVSGLVNSFTLELNNAINFIPVWPASVEWQAGIVPLWSDGKDTVSFVTRDAGSSWQGYFGGFDFKVPS